MNNKAYFVKIISAFLIFLLLSSSAWATPGKKRRAIKAGKSLQGRNQVPPENTSGEALSARDPIPMEWDWLKARLILTQEKGRMIIRTELETPGEIPISSLAGEPVIRSPETFTPGDSLVSDGFPSHALVGCLARLQAKADSRKKEAMDRGVILPSQKTPPSGFPATPPSSIVSQNPSTEKSEGQSERIGKAAFKENLPGVSKEVEKSSESEISGASQGESSPDVGLEDKPSGVAFPGPTQRDERLGSSEETFERLLASFLARRKAREKCAESFGVILPSKRILRPGGESSMGEGTSPEVHSLSSKLSPPPGKIVSQDTEPVLMQPDPASNHKVPFEYREKNGPSKNEQGKPLELKSGKMTSLFFEITESQ